MDGTIKVVNQPWQQLFSIHAFVRSGDAMKQIPLVFCFMSGKSKDDYYAVSTVTVCVQLRLIRKHCNYLFPSELLWFLIFNVLWSLIVFA